MNFLKQQVSINFNKFLKVSVFLLFCFAWFSVVNAAILYLEPASGEYQAGETFIEEIKIDTEGECVNAINVNLIFPSDIMKAVDFSKADSILSLWLKNPKIDQNLGLISFSGGIPGGYCGKVPGDPGVSNLLGKIIFKVPGMMVGKSLERKGEIKFLDTSQVFLNDGLGTLANLTSRNAVIKIVKAKSLETPKDEWQEELAKDNIPPEPFEIEINQDPLIFEGKYFIIFQTQDKQTGIDHYEVAEQRRTIRGITQKEEWKRAESPYLLEDQTLQSIIKVKAVDKVGNERIVEYLPEKKPFPYWIIILILVGIGIIWWIIKRRKTQNFPRSSAKLP